MHYKPKSKFNLGAVYLSSSYNTIANSNMLYNNLVNVKNIQNIGTV